MKPMQFIFYFMIFNAVLMIFSVIGIFPTSTDVRVDDDTWEQDSITSVLSTVGITGIGTGALSVIGGIISVKAGLNPFLGVAYGAITGFFASFWINLSITISNISSSMGEFGYILNTVFILITSIIAILFLYTIIQMTTGGGKSFE